MLAEDVRRVHTPCYMVEADNLGGNGFPDPVERQSIVPLLDSVMGDRGGIDYRLIVPEYHGAPLYRDT